MHDRLSVPACKQYDISLVPRPPQAFNRIFGFKSGLLNRKTWLQAWERGSNWNVITLRIPCALMEVPQCVISVMHCREEFFSPNTTSNNSFGYVSVVYTHSHLTCRNTEAYWYILLGVWCSLCLLVSTHWSCIGWMLHTVCLQWNWQTEHLLWPSHMYIASCDFVPGWEAWMALPPRGPGWVLRHMHITRVI